MKLAVILIGLLSFLLPACMCNVSVFSLVEIKTFISLVCSLLGYCVTRHHSSSKESIFSDFCHVYVTAIAACASEIRAHHFSVGENDLSCVMKALWISTGTV